MFFEAGDQSRIAFFCQYSAIIHLKYKIGYIQPESICYAVQTGHCKLILRGPNTYLKSTVSQPYRCYPKPYTGSDL